MALAVEAAHSAAETTPAWREALEPFIHAVTPYTQGAGSVLIGIGVVFSVIGAIGLIRLPDLYARLHGAGVIDTLGAGSVLLGLVLHAGLSLTTAKLLMIAMFILITSPTSGHALSRAALYAGLRPEADVVDIEDLESMNPGADVPSSASRGEA